jgi:hypothetical protein
VRKRSLERPRRAWVDTTKMNLVGMGWDDVDWIRLAQDRYSFVSAVMSLRVP